MISAEETANAVIPSRDAYIQYLAQQRGVHPVVIDLEIRAGEQITDLIVNSNEKYTVLGIDCFYNHPWIVQRYKGSNAQEQALAEARRLTTNRKQDDIFPGIPSVKYFVFSPRGDYISHKN